MAGTETAQRDQNTETGLLSPESHQKVSHRERSVFTKQNQWEKEREKEYEKERELSAQIKEDDDDVKKAGKQFKQKQNEQKHVKETKEITEMVTTEMPKSTDVRGVTGGVRRIARMYIYPIKSCGPVQVTLITLINSPDYPITLITLISR